MYIILLLLHVYCLNMTDQDYQSASPVRYFLNIAEDSPSDVSQPSVAVPMQSKFHAMLCNTFGEGGPPASDQPIAVTEHSIIVLSNPVLTFPLSALNCTLDDVLNAMKTVVYGVPITCEVLYEQLKLELSLIHDDDKNQRKFDEAKKVISYYWNRMKFEERRRLSGFSMALCVQRFEDLLMPLAISVFKSALVQANCGFSIQDFKTSAGN